MQVAWLGRGQLRREFVQHRDVVAGLEGGLGHQGAAADLLERVLQLRRPVGGVDVDEHEARVSGAELHDQPLGPVRGEHTDAVARLEPERK